LHEWEVELANRSDEVKKTIQGRRETGMWKQTVQNIEPLIERLKSKTLPYEQLKRFVSMFDLAAQREYVEANSEYIKLSVGNAPWPMGVTMVGIHARSARER